MKANSLYGITVALIPLRGRTVLHAVVPVTNVLEEVDLQRENFSQDMKDFA